MNAASSNQSTRALEGRLAYLPVSVFGSIMGLSGLAIAWRVAASGFGAPAWVGEAVAMVAVVAFVVLVIAYGIKCLSAPEAVKAEFNHPIAGNFFATFIISLLLLPVLIAPWLLWLAQSLWVIGTVLMVAFAWRVVQRWTTARQQPVHATPAWILPVVGTLNIPTAGMSLHLPGAPAVSVFGLAVGLWFTVPLFTLILSRLIFAEPLPAALRPSLLILVAPFAVGFTAYVNVAGQIDLFAHGLFCIGLFLFAVLLPQLGGLPFRHPFRVSWWAVSFPLAALAIASIKVAVVAQSLPAHVLAVGLLGVTTVVIGALAGLSLSGTLRGQLRTLSS